MTMTREQSERNAETRVLRTAVERLTGQARHLRLLLAEQPRPDVSFGPVAKDYARYLDTVRRYCPKCISIVDGEPATNRKWQEKLPQLAAELQEVEAELVTAQDNLARELAS